MVVLIVLVVLIVAVVVVVEVVVEVVVVADTVVVVIDVDEAIHEKELFLQQVTNSYANMAFHVVLF